jgi:opacity protein-like surface antigen
MRFFLVLILLATGLIPLPAQRFIGGIMAGFTASQVDGDSYAGYNKPGFQGGVFVTTPMNTLFSARLEIRYSSRGALHAASKDNTGYYRLGLHYIDIPVSATLMVKHFGWIEAGLIPGYLFAAGGRDDAGKLPDETLVEFRKFDLGTMLGVHFRLTEKLSLQVRYAYSLFSIRDPDVAGSYYSWFGKLFGHSQGDFNNYLSAGLALRLK